MKTTPISALALAAFFSLFTFSLFAQVQIATDSLSVEWEQLDGPPGAVFKYMESGGKMYAGTNDGFYTSTNNGISWKLNQTLGHRKLDNFYVRGNVIIAIVKSLPTYGRPLVWRSADGGVSWEERYDPLYFEIYATLFERSDLLVTNDSVITLCGSGYTWQSFDSGVTWDLQYIPNMLTLNANANVISGIWSYGGGFTEAFVTENADFHDPQIINTSTLPAPVSSECYTAFENGRFSIILENGSLYQTTDLGASWSVRDLSMATLIQGLINVNDTFYLRTNTGIWCGTLDENAVFTKVYNGEGSILASVNAFSVTNSGFWVNAINGTTLFSADDGASWENRSKNLVSKVAGLRSFCGKLTAFSGSANDQSIGVEYHSNQQDGEWAITPHATNPEIIGEVNGVLYGYIPFTRSLDCGLTWDTILYPQIHIQAAPEKIVQSGNRAYCWNKFGYPIEFSDDNGSNWLKVPEPQNFSTGISLLAFGDTLFYLANMSGTIVMHYTSNLGQSWETYPAHQRVHQIYREEHGKLVGTSVKGSFGTDTAYVLVSEDLGRTWIQTFSTRQPYLADNSSSPRFLLRYDGMLMLHAANGVFISHNEGVNWTRLIDLPFINYSSYYNAPEPFLQGASSYIIDEGYLYAATEAQGIWRTPYAPIRDHVKVQSSEYGYLKGRLYRDIDGDCQYNPANGDKPLGNKALVINPGNILTTTDASGVYNVALPVGDYTVSATPPLYYQALCSNDTISASISVGNTVTADLSYSPIPGIRDLCVLTTTPVAARPGFDVTYKIQVSNVGTVSVSDAVTTFFFDSEWLTPIDISPIGQFAGNKAIIALPVMAPGDVVIITMNFNVSATTPLGTELFFTADCPVSEDANAANNTVRTSQIVRGSYDPNDKNAQPLVPQPPGQARILDYLIRFQNTGTDTAFTVVVTDTLQAGFDILSLQTLESSHPFLFSINSGRVAKWTFRNILLPDSNINEAASHGYVRFQIATNPDLLPGTLLLNDADIFFDFNSPVRTNEFATENLKWTVENTSTIKLCAGDSWNGITWTSSNIFRDTIGDAWSDTISIVQLDVSPVWELQLDTIMQLGGIFIDVLVLHDTVFSLHYLSVEGCDSSVVWNITVQTSSLQEADDTDAQFDLHPNPSSDCIWLTLKEEGLNGIKNPDVKLYNASGMLMHTWSNVATTASQPFRLEMNDLPAGVYFVMLQSELVSGIKRLVRM